MSIWTALALIAALSLVAIAPSRIPLHAPRMSFVDYLDQVNWRGLLTDAESGLACLGLLAFSSLIVVYSVTRSSLVRACLVTVVLVVPALAFSDRASEFALWFVRMPYRAVTGTAHALLGYGNGQFYRDGPFALAVIGWWTLFCLLLLLREGLQKCRKHTSAEQMSGKTQDFQQP